MSININRYVVTGSVGSPHTVSMKKGGIIRNVDWNGTSLIVFAQEDSTASSVDRTFYVSNVGSSYPVDSVTNVFPDPVFLGAIPGPYFAYEIITTSPTNTQAPDVVASPLAINTDPQTLYTHKGAQIIGCAWTDLGSGSFPTLFVLQDGDEPSEVRTIRQINTTQDVGTLMNSAVEVHTIGTVRNPATGAVQHYFWTLA